MIPATLLILIMICIGGCNMKDPALDAPDELNETTETTETTDVTDAIPLEARYDDTTVIPQTFGAVGDGKTDDVISLRRAIKYAKENGLTVTLPEAEYFTSTPLIIGDVTIISENAKISYHGLQQSEPAIHMQDNAKIYGTLHIWSVDNERSNHGGRCGMAFGDYGSGEGVSNCYVEHVVITGGVPDANGILITGDSNNITIDKVTVPAGTNITRAVLVHWGNANDHYVVKHGVEYGHVDNWKPTTHPHDLHFGTIEATDLARSSLSTATNTAPLCISAGYDITVDEVIGNNTDFVVMIIPGDICFDYASEEERAFGARNLIVNKAVGNGTAMAALYAVGYSGYLPDGDALIDLTVNEAIIKGSGSRNAYGAALHKVAKVTIGTMTVTDCNATVVHLGAGSRNVTIDTLHVEDCDGQMVNVTSKSHERIAENLTIHTMNVKNCQSGGRSAINLEKIDGVHIGTMTVEDSRFDTVLSLYSTAKNVRIDTLNAASAASLALVRAAETIPAANNISIGETDCGDIPLSTGSACVVKIGD